MNFTGEQIDFIILSIIYNDYALKKYHIKSYTLAATFEKVKDYCKATGRATFNYLWRYLLASKLLSGYNWDLEAIKAEAEEVKEEFNRLIEELEASQTGAI